MYSRRFKETLGFHGCDLKVATVIVNANEKMRPSNNPHDWLGPGVYFWENSFSRAELFADAQHALHLKRTAEGKPKSVNAILTPSVIGAVLDLGFCLDLTDTACLEELAAAFFVLEGLKKTAGGPMLFSGRCSIIRVCP